MTSNETEAPDGQLVPIPGFIGYFANRMGEIWTVHRKGKVPTGAGGKFLDMNCALRMKPWRCRQGYLHHTLVDGGPRTRNRKSLHSLIALTFIGPRPSELVVAHLDGNKDNNRPENLNYVTQQENVNHKRVHGTMLCGDRSHMSRLTDEECREMLFFLDEGFSRRQVAEAYGVSLSHVYALRTGRIRRHLTEGVGDQPSAVEAPTIPA